MSDPTTWLEELDSRAIKVVEAITNKGSHPTYHDRIRNKHIDEWPTLWAALAELVELYEQQQTTT